MKEVLCVLALSSAVCGKPLELSLDKSFDRRVDLDSQLRQVRCQFQGQPKLSVTWGKRTQQLPLDTVAEGNPGPRGTVLIADFNFDGRLDLGLPSGIGYGGVNLFYSVFTYQKNQFVRLDSKLAICNPKFSAADKTLLTNSRSGPYWYGTDYRFQSGRGWTWRKRLPVSDDRFTPGDFLLTLFEEYNPAGRLTSARLSSDPDQWKPVTLQPTQTITLYPSPGAAAQGKKLEIGEKVSTGRVQQSGAKVYVEVTPGRGWLEMAQGAVQR